MAPNSVRSTNKYAAADYLLVTMHQAKGAFNNYVDKKRWLGGQPNVFVCLHGVGR